MAAMARAKQYIYNKKIHKKLGRRLNCLFSEAEFVRVDRIKLVRFGGGAGGGRDKSGESDGENLV